MFTSEMKSLVSDGQHASEKEHEAKQGRDERLAYQKLCYFVVW